MAMRCSLLSAGTPLKAKSLMPKNRPPMLRSGQVAVVEHQTATVSVKKFAQVNKVFEDKASGVICYRDEDGELICEGYDEGPRFTWQAPQSYKRQTWRYRMESCRLN